MWAVGKQLDVYGGGGDATRHPGSARGKENLRTEELPVELELVAVLDCLDGVLKLVEARIMGRVSA